MGESLQEMIDTLPSGGGTIALDNSIHYVHGPLNMRGRAGVRIIGEGYGTEIASILDDDAPLFVDFTGSHHCGIEMARVWNKGAAPRVGMVLARRNDDASAGHHVFRGLRWEGAATLANVASLGSEINTWDDCEFLNNIPGGLNFLTGRTNRREVASPFGEVCGGSNLVQRLTNCSMGMYQPGGINLAIEAGTGQFHFHGGNLSNKTERRDLPGDPLQAAFVIGRGDPNYPCEQIHIDAVNGETYGCNNSLQVLGRVRGLRLTGTLLESREAAIVVNESGALADSLIEQNTLHAGMAHYEWSDRPGRALMRIDGEMTDTKVDLSSRWLGLLAEDQSPYDEGHRPEYALAIGDTAKLSDNTVLLRRRRHVIDMRS
jgi:hypothetical protein